LARRAALLGSAANMAAGGACDCSAVRQRADGLNVGAAMHRSVAPRGLGAWESGSSVYANCGFVSVQFLNQMT